MAAVSLAIELPGWLTEVETLPFLKGPEVADIKLSYANDPCNKLLFLSLYWVRWVILPSTTSLRPQIDKPPYEALGVMKAPRPACGVFEVLCEHLEMGIIHVLAA